jgi:hypothetical protein
MMYSREHSLQHAVALRVEQDDQIDRADTSPVHVTVSH